MTYENYLNKLEKRLNKRLKKGESVNRIQILKNNGVKLDGFSYHIEGHREQPTVYVNHYYREDMSLEELDMIVKLILKVQRDSRLFPEEELEAVFDYHQMKNQVYYRLISREQNTELLKQVPWLPWLDLAIVFYIRIPEHIVEGATALIHTSHMEHWGITIQELYGVAARNMAEISVQLDPMENFLGGFGFDMLHSGMYVLSSHHMEFGAAAIINPQIQQKCFQKLGEDYYVLPSSIHEVILLPVSRASGRRNLDMMVQEVNQKCVSREDFLSSHAYFYSSKDGELRF